MRGAGAAGLATVVAERGFSAFDTVTPFRTFTTETLPAFFDWMIAMGTFHDCQGAIGHLPFRRVAYVIPYAVNDGSRLFAFATANFCSSSTTLSMFLPA